MSGLLRVFLGRRGFVPKADAATRQRANYIVCKAAKEPESIGAMTVLFVSILGPSGWVLSHIYEYRNDGSGEGDDR
ncbi:hypothetical protein NHX12_014201 [Muraenolepis orangiensis]|uniref:Uncharacterized protein n=1 Tax=Muraenolepis orangiensis TaxID=630683 RepID=A0A9Q0DF37_9TELE|nr:hypothetical protein NHX12_014201 [Muraenolepis orangiensis]